MKTSEAERFWAFVPDRPADGCWLFWGSRDRTGYGRFQVGTRLQPRVERAHRVAWRLTRGPIPRRKRIVHICREPSCVNPDHLQLGTMLDRHRAEGEDAGSAKLTDATVRAVRREVLDRGRRQREVAHEFGISESQVSNLVRGLQRRGAGGPIREAAW